MRRFPKVPAPRSIFASIGSQRLRRGLVSFIAVFLGYAVASELHIAGRPEFLPKYPDILATLQDVLATGLLQKSVIESTARMLQGYALGCTIGIVLGLVMGLSGKLNFTLYPLLQFVRFTPALAFLPLYVLWFGGGEFSKILLIATGVSVVV